MRARYRRNLQREREREDGIKCRVHIEWYRGHGPLYSVYSFLSHLAGNLASLLHSLCLHHTTVLHCLS